MHLPITVIIRTLNEEENISECIKHSLLNNPLEIIVVDGGSKDQTINILSNINGVRVIQTKQGLARQRDVGINFANKKSEYIAIVDADDRLDEKCLFNLYNDLEKSKAAAAQAIHSDYSKISDAKLSYWEKAMLVNMKIIRAIEKTNPDNISMIGRPALYRKDLLLKVILKESDQYITAAEDADLAYKLKEEGAFFIIGTGVTYRKYLKTFKELFKRWLSYGSGDAKFIKTHPERLWHVLNHLLFNYPIKRSFLCAKDYSIKYTPFFILQGLVRLYGMLKFFLFGIGTMDKYK